MQLIIISGKIGSGKSTLSRYFQKKDYHYINSDILAKNIIQNDKYIIDKLNKEFNILNNEKITYLQKLKTLFLASKENKDKINLIIHPFFYKELNLMLKKSSGNKIILELPLIETSSNIKYDYKIVTVKTKLEIRKQRYLAKSASKIKDFMVLNKYQKSSEYYEKYSDYVISNNDTIEILETKFNNLYSKFKDE